MVAVLFLGPWFGVFRIGLASWTGVGTTGAGIGGAEGAGRITVVMVEFQQQHLQKQ
jgi:hypothetical protein